MVMASKHGELRVPTVRNLLPNLSMAEVGSSPDLTLKLTQYSLPLTSSTFPLVQKVPTWQSPQRHLHRLPYTFRMCLLYYLRCSVLKEKIRNTNKKNK